jgi:two-component system chemotaxis response regulator CheB
MRQRDEALSKKAHRLEGDLADFESPANRGASQMEDSLDELGLGEDFLAATPEAGALPDFSPQAYAAAALKVLVVEDSPFFARQLQKTLEAEGDIEVIAIAKNGQEALDILSSSAHVDVITLDVEMPVMPGGTALKHIMIRHRIPSIVISAFQPKAMGQIFEYMELGAVDFISKPAAGDDIDRFGWQLRDLARKASAAELSHFRRLRKGGATPSSSDRIVRSAGESPDVLLVLGAEGAYVDWLRISWPQLCEGRLVIGLQKLPAPFLSQFCQLIETRACVRTALVANGCTVAMGSLCLGNGGRAVDVKLTDAGVLEVRETCGEDIQWEEGIRPWIHQLTLQARHRLNILCLSAAHQIAPELIEHIVNCEARLILPPRDCIMLPELQDGIQPYAHLAPHQVVVSSPENLLEVLAGNE